MSLASRLFISGLFAVGALASSACVLAATPTVAATPADASGSIAAANSRLLTPGAYAMTDVNDNLRYQTAGVSSSVDAVDTEIASLSADPGAGEGASAGQYGRRRSYGRSRYEDRLHNKDGSTKIAFMAGAGLNVPVGNTGKYYKPSYDFAVGGGINLSRQFGILAEFHYDHAGITDNALNYEYNNLIAGGYASASDLAGFNGNSHLLSFTIDPVLTLTQQNSHLGAYVTGGVGYYRKTTNFTIPTYGTACGYYSCYSYTTNVNVDQYSANAFGANGGVGFTYRLSEFSSERLFVEARYHWINAGNGGSQEFFPYNKRNSEYVPVTVGIRF